MNVHEGKRKSGNRQWKGKTERKEWNAGWRRRAPPWEQSSPIQPGKHWQEPSMGLQVPLLVQRQISAQALPYLPLGQTAKHSETKHPFTKQPWSAYHHKSECSPLTLRHLTWTHYCAHIYANKLIVWKVVETNSSNGWCCSIWVDMKWSDLFKQKEESITASCGITAPFPLTRVEWVMCHRIKIDHVHRPLYTFFMKLIFQCSPARFNKRCHFQWNLHCVFFLGRETNWTKVYLTIRIRELQQQQIHQRSHIKRIAQH